MLADAFQVIEQEGAAVVRAQMQPEVGRVVCGHDTDLWGAEVEVVEGLPHSFVLWCDPEGLQITHHVGPYLVE